MANGRSKAIKQGQDDAAQRGRRSGPPVKVSDAVIRAVMHLGSTEAAQKVGLSRAQYIVRRGRLNMTDDEVGEKVATRTVDHDDIEKRLLARKAEMMAIAKKAKTVEDLRGVLLMLIRTL